MDDKTPPLLSPPAIDPKSRETIANRQEQEKTALVAQFKMIPVILVACQKCGISRATYYRWKNEDEEFARKAQEAIKDGVARISDIAESKLIQKIQNGETNAIFYWLNHRSPDYASKPNVLITPNDNKAIGRITVTWGDEKGVKK